jgi:hypothetical protein
MRSSEGLTSANCVDHPPPSATIGKNVVAVLSSSRSATGSVVMRNSERLLTKPRSAIAETGTSEVNVSVPSAGRGTENGASSKNRATCPCAGRVKLPAAESVPERSVKKKETLAAVSFGLATAKPVSTPLPISTKILPFEAGTVAGTPASDIRTPFGPRHLHKRLQDPTMHRDSRSKSHPFH